MRSVLLKYQPISCLTSKTHNGYTTRNTQRFSTCNFNENATMHTIAAHSIHLLCARCRAHVSISIYSIYNKEFTKNQLFHPIITMPFICLHQKVSPMHYEIAHGTIPSSKIGIETQPRDGIYHSLSITHIMYKMCGTSK